MVIHMEIRQKLNRQAAAQELHYAWKEYSLANAFSWCDPDTANKVEAAKRRVNEAYAMLDLANKFGRVST